MNTKNYHAFVKKKLCQNYAHKNSLQNGTYDIEDLIASSSINVFENHFNKNFTPQPITQAQLIPHLIYMENNTFHLMPTLVKDIYHAMNSDSMAGPDGFTSNFLELLGDYKRGPYGNFFFSFTYMPLFYFCWAQS